MAIINTDYLVRCVNALDTAFQGLRTLDRSDAMYDIFRAASVKEFELVLEQSGSLLRKRLRPYFASNRDVDRLTFRNVFRHAAKRGLISVEACERWFAYRDNRNDTPILTFPLRGGRDYSAHEYGEGFAETTLTLIPAFIADARELARVIGEESDD